MTIISGRITDSNSAQQITTTVDTKFNSAVFFGYSGFLGGVPLNNSGNLYIGVNSGVQPMVLTTGGSINWSIPNKTKEDLYNFWIRGTAPNGFYCIIYDV